MSDTRPSGGELDGAAQLLASARARVSAAIADLALPDDLRLSDRDRAILATLLATLVRGVEDELRSALAERFGNEGEEALAAALSSAHVAIALPILVGGPALTDPALIAILLRRAEEHRLHRAGTADSALLIELAGDRDATLAAEAMGLLIAQSGRLDAFREPIIGRAELPAELQHGLVWAIAAALRNYAVARHAVDAAAADSIVAAAASALLAAYDEGASIDARALRLVRRLADQGRLDDDLVLRTLSEGSLPLFAAALAVRADLDQSAAWEILCDRAGRGAVLILRAAGVARGAAGALLIRLRADAEAVAPLLDLYDTTPPEKAASLLALWRIDPAYRSAVASLAA